MMGLYLDELELGKCHELGSYVFTDENTRRFKERYAPVPFHMNDSDATQGLFGRPVVVGLHLCAAWMPCFVGVNARERERLEQEGKVLPERGAGFGIFDIRWPKPVYTGDEVVYTTRLVAKRELASKPRWGLIEQVNEGRRNGEVVVRFGSKMLVERRPAQ